MIISPKEFYENLKNGSDKKIKLKCDICGKITETAYHNYTVSQKRNNRNGETYCLSCSSRANAKKRIGIPSPLRGIERPNMRGKKSPTWNGGSYISYDGYRMKHIGCEGRGRAKNGWSSYKKEHVLVIEEHIGRKIKSGEVIHHIDGNKLNNSIENLILLKREKNHRLVHNTLQDIGYELYRLGLIEFDRKKEEYKVAHVKLRELLGPLEEGNQQPSLNGNVFEGSETSSEAVRADNSTKSAGH